MITSSVPRTNWRSQLAAMKYLADRKPNQYKLIHYGRFWQLDERRMHLYYGVYYWVELHKVELTYRSAA